MFNKELNKNIIIEWNNKIKQLQQKNLEEFTKKNNLKNNSTND